MIIDKIEVGIFLRSRPSPPHVHPCPECYTSWPCAMNCFIEPDLEMDNGIPSGSYVACHRCAPHAKESYHG